MNRNDGTSRMIILVILGLLLLGGLLPPRPAEALHDQGYICYICHSLNPADIRPGSNSILRIPAGNILGSIPTKPTRTDLPLPGTNGYPISCDFCHSSGSDVPAAKFASKTYKHPVDLIQTGDNTSNPQEITCNDCHNGNDGGTGFPDLTPSTLIAKTATDGYPDHDNVNNVYAHDLTNNPPHLTAAYWGSTNPGSNRTNDTTFWTNVRGDTQDMVCWVCHAAGRQSPFTQVTSTKLIKGEYVAPGTDNTKGHKIRTTVAGAIQPGAALPCYDCHDSHGSVNHGLVLDNQSIYGASTAAVAVTNYVGARPYPDRFVCAQCHDTGNTATAGSKAIPAQAGKIVEGMYPVDPFNSTATAGLHSAAGIADNMANSTKNCLSANAGCHASPHNPIGESTGGLNCGTCHSAIYQGMDNGSSGGYHHVMMSDAAPGGTYPTNATPGATASDRTCAICHVDHNYFSKLVSPALGRARNLRRTIGVQPDNGANAPVQTDYDNSYTNGGICTSCHLNAQTKRQPGTDIKNDGVGQTSVVSVSIYNPGAHNYPTVPPSILGHFSADNATTQFLANCSKCHNGDPSSTSFQDNAVPNRFSLHDTTSNKLTAPLGLSSANNQDNVSERFCYRCHSKTSDAVGGTAKPANGFDYYNNRAMDNAAESIFRQFQRTSHHPVNAAEQVTGTRQLDCLNCHNVHAARSVTGSIAANPDNTYAFDLYDLTDNSATRKTNRSNFCLKCHDGTPPSGPNVSGTTYIPQNVALSGAAMNKSTYGARGHWSVSGQFQDATRVACDACHDKHGSTFPKLLGTFDSIDGGNKVFGSQQTVVLPNTSSPTAQDNASVCRACHNNAGVNYPPTSVSLASINTQEGFRDGTGYFSPNPVSATTMRWPGFAVWDNLSSISSGNGSFPVSPHRNTSKTGPSALGSRAVADCNGCHDPHGTANTYNMLTDNMAAGNYRLCFDCHGAGGPAADSIAPYYPAAAGGTGAAASATVHTGHNVKTSGGKLSQYTALPCYDCHVTHGSRNGNTQMKSDQRWSNLGNTKYGSTPSDNTADNNARIFCLGCHVTTDDRDGYGNTVTASDNVENLSRLGANRLKLPTTNAIVEHTSAWAGNGCQRCHGGRNYNDNTYGPHYPGTGLCDLCHESQGARATTDSWNGAHRTHTDNAQYGFACKQCHTWTGTSSRATHKNDSAATQYAEVAFDNQATSGWLTIQYATAFQYEYRSIYNNPYTGGAAAPTYTSGADNGTLDLRQGTVRWTNGSCGNVWCHSNANPLQVVQGAFGVSNQYRGASWVDNSLGTTCTGCHGGDRTSGAIIGDNTTPTNGSIAHLKHVNGNIGCYKCHYNTVATANNRQVDNVSSHVNASKDVVFEPSTVGGTWNNGAKTCAATYCHGTPATLPDWDNLATVTGCGVCHQNQGAATSGVSFSGAHHGHTTYAKMRVACEACHAEHAGSHANTVHSGGPDNAAAGKTAEVGYTDNAANQTYDNVAAVYLSKDLWNNPFTGLPVAPAPGYANAPTPTGNDAVNANISWTQGTCSSVWCHSNANPLGGANAYRSPQWTATCTDCHRPSPSDVDCTQCHGVKAAAAQMGTADNLSRVHVRHAATDRYNFTCDECHAWTVPNDSHGLTGLGIISGTGHDNHVNGIKTIRFSTTLRTTNIDQGGGTYDNAAGNYRCYNIYCHSAGLDNVPTNGSGTGFAQPGGWPRDNTVGWDNTPSAVCTSCHKGSSTSGFPMDSLAHDNHVLAPGTGARAGYPCYRCHNATVAADNVTITNYSNHVNGYRNVAFNTGTGTYTNATLTCSNTPCHQQGQPLFVGPTYFDNVSVRWDNNVETYCKRCHGSQTGVGYHTSWVGEPNYDNNIVTGARNSHQKHIYSTDSTKTCALCHPGVSAAADNTFTSVTTHVNDNVEVQQGTGATFTWSQAQHRCTNISCHGGTGTQADWGQTLNCQACHVGTGDRNDYAVNDCAARIDNTQWQGTGHGRASAFPATASGNPAPNDGTRFGAAADPNCTNYCHDSAISHAADNAVTTNFFRLATGTGGSGRTAVTTSTANDVCRQCHTTGGAYAAQATRDIVTGHYGAKHSTDNNGGYFCWDCHDPHGDNNDYMIHATPSVKTDYNGTDGFGKPTLQKATGFDRAGGDNATEYDWNDYVNNGYNGLCQVCHNAAVNHFDNTSKYDTNHNPGNRCTNCHGDTRKHDIDFRGLGTCIGCHSGTQGAAPVRRQVTGASGDFTQATHHVTNYVDNTADGAVQNVDCSECHWEGWLATDIGFPANSAGKTNPAYHYADLSSNATAKYVQLRVWSTNAAPTNYTNSAPVLWRNDAVFDVLANSVNMNSHCVGCHGGTIGAATPFSDGRSPRVRAWDGLDIGTKYLRNGAANTRLTHLYNNTTYNVVPAVNKALSPHFDLQNNVRGVATTGAWADDDSAGASGTATGTVACFDCHNSHGSSVTGTATLPLVSYADNATLNAGLTNANVGGLLKATTAGVSGYSTTYAPASNATMNWGAGSAACFDCHVGSTAGGTPPKMYTSYGRGLDNIVAGYYDPVQWRTVTANRQGHGVWDTARTWEGSFAFKDNTIRATHFRNDSAIRALQTTPARQLNGLCSRFHDPHGVTTNTSMVSNAGYGTPALKGTWMTSPYFEDRPGEVPSGTSTTQVLNTSNDWSFNNRAYMSTSARGFVPRAVVYRAYNRPPVLGGGYGTTGGGVGASGFFIDENTFGLTLTGGTVAFDMFGNTTPGGATANVWSNLWNGGYGVAVTININRITETNAQFAGLCERCHTPASLVNTASKAANIITHAHRTVKGWDALAGGPAAADIFKNYHINVTTSNGTFSQKLLGQWALNNMAANFSDYRVIEDPNEPWSGFPYHWGVNLNRTGGQFVNNYIQTNYHQFPCSKCHTPHTSRLPRLLRTNCLDTGTVMGNVGGSSNWGTTGSWVQRHTLNSTNAYINRFRMTTNATHRWTPARATRCHQDAYKINGTAANDTRWNDLTPW